MAENPLLPNARLRELYLRLQRAKALTPRGLRYDAAFASTTIHLEPRDFLLPMPGDDVAATLHAEANTPKSTRGKKTSAKPTLALLPDASSMYLSFATGAALLQQQAEDGSLTLTFMQTGLRGNWAESLTFAQKQRLPLILACTEASGPKRAGALTHATLQPLAKKLGLPVVWVDATDAVAVYRVMQECCVRARQGGGPAILWCVSSQSVSPADPLKNMKQYLAARGLLPRDARQSPSRK